MVRSRSFIATPPGATIREQLESERVCCKDGYIRKAY